MKILKQLFCPHFWIEDYLSNHPLNYEYVLFKGQLKPYICTKCDKKIRSFTLPISYIFIIFLTLFISVNTYADDNIRQGSYVVWYGNVEHGDRIHGNRYGDYNFRGEKIDWNGYTAASYSFKQNTKVRIFYKNRYIDIIINDKGGHKNPQRHRKPIILELTPRAFKDLTGNLKLGKVKVRVIKLKSTIDKRKLRGG